jgi:hypothetical protein
MWVWCVYVRLTGLCQGPLYSTFISEHLGNCQSAQLEESDAPPIQQDWHACSMTDHSRQLEMLACCTFLHEKFTFTCRSSIVEVEPTWRNPSLLCKAPEGFSSLAPGSASFSSMSTLHFSFLSFPFPFSIDEIGTQLEQCPDSISREIFLHLLWCEWI